MTAPDSSSRLPGFSLDHLVVAADTLEAGSDYLWERFGVRPSGGGQHAGWGTHNQLLALGGGTYLEVIAVDPTQPAPAHARPFGLDEADQRERIAVRPRLVHYMLRTHDIAALQTLLDYDAGPVQTMSRGDLVWQLTVPATRPARRDALHPALIDWGDQTPPGERLAPQGVVLTALHLRGPAQSCARLQPLTHDRRILVGERGRSMIAAEFQTPRGWAILD